MTPPIAFDRINAILFDIGGVFLTPHPRAIDLVLEAVGVSAHEDHEIYRQAHYAGVRGLTDAMDPAGNTDEQDLSFWANYDERYFTHLGVPADQISEANSVRDGQRKRPVRDVWTLELTSNIGAVSRLAACGVRIGILSNNDGTAAEQMEHHGVCQLGDGPLTTAEVIVDSTVVGIAKPDPAIFDLALEPLGLPAEEVLYVGDTVHADVVGATRAGLPVIQLDPLDLHPEFDHHRLPGVSELATIFEQR